MLLHISTLSGSLPPVEVPADATTKELKRRIQSFCPETANRKMQLMKSENVKKGATVKYIELKMDKLLSSYGIKDGSQLSVVFGEYHVIDRADVDELLRVYLQMTQSESTTKLICETFAYQLCECTGALNFSDLTLKVIGPEFVADGFCAAIAEALSSTIHSISTLDFSSNNLQNPTIRLIKQCILSNPNITELNLSNTNLQREDATVIASIIASNSTIRKLDISGNNFLSSGIAAIARALSKSNSVTDFDVSNSDEASREMDSSKCETLANALVAMIKLNLSIKRLNLSSMFLTEDCIKLVMSALQTNQTIAELDISGNILTGSGISALSNMITSNSSIIKLQMSKIVDAYFKYSVPSNENVLFGAFNFNSTITDLEIDCSGFSNAGTRAFASSIASNSTILKLNISHTFVDKSHLIFDALAQNRSLVELTTSIPSLDDPESVLELSRALPNMIRCNSSIVKLDLSQSDFSSESIVISISDALSHNLCIQELILNNCRINSDGGIALANMLSVNQTISKLHLNSHNFSRDGLLMIIMALRNNSSIQDIGLALCPGCQIEDRGSFLSRAIAETIRCNTSITRLNIAKLGKGFGKDSAAELASALKHNQSITDINLQSCFYFLDSSDHTKAAAAIADLISWSDCRIKTLNLSFNSFSDVQMVLIADALSSSQSVTGVDVTGNCLQVCDKVINSFVNSIKQNRNIESIALIDASEFDRCRKVFDESTKRLADKSLMQYPQLECPGVPYIYNYLDQ